MVHSLHLWSLNVDKVCLTAHLATGEKTVCKLLMLCISLVNSVDNGKLLKKNFEVAVIRIEASV